MSGGQNKASVDTLFDVNDFFEILKFRFSLLHGIEARVIKRLLMLKPGRLG